MNLVCPDCRGELAVAEYPKGVCRSHGGEYEILFDRSRSERASVAPTFSHAPPAVLTERTASEQLSNGARGCLNCGQDRASCSCSGDDAALPAAARAGASRGSPCAQHRDVRSEARCSVCSHAVCETCELTLPTGLRVCPACIESEGWREVPPRRRNLAMASLFFALYGTLMVVSLATGAFASAFGVDDEASLSGLVVVFVLIPCMIGSSLSLGAWDSRFRNTTLIHVALTWNLLLIGIYGLLTIVGIFG
jgi:hypothetical protein